MADQRTIVEVDGHQLELSNLTKVLFSDGFTKGQVIDYYARIGSVLLPHLAERPLTLIRFPNGTAAPHFFEKRCPAHAPSWVTTADVPSGRKGVVRHVVCDSQATLVWLANLAALELHPLLSRRVDLNHPTVAMFDLDPGSPADILTAGKVALALKTLLENAGFAVYVKTSGSKGLHVVMPLADGITYEKSRPFAQQVARTMERNDPDLVVSVQTKTERAGKVLVDWNQNGFTNTTASVYSLRAKDRPLVSTPITWDELDDALIRADTARLQFGPEEVLARVAKWGDLWAGLN